MKKEPNSPTWWFDLARCRTWHLARAFQNPIGGNTQLAKRACETCWAIEVCAWFAMALEEDDSQLRFHVYGGLSGRERQAFMRNHHITRDRAKAEYEAARHRLWELASMSDTVVDWPH